MKCEFHHRSSSKDNERPGRVCLCAKQFFEYSEDGGVRQAYYIPFKLLLAKCSKCGRRDGSTLKLGLGDRSYVCCNCQGDLSFKERMYIKTTGSSIFKKIKKRHHHDRSLHSDKHDGDYSSTIDSLTYIRNSQEALKSLELPAIVTEFKQHAPLDMTLTSPQHRRSKKLSKKNLYQSEVETELVKKVLFTKYNPFEKLKKMHTENGPLIGVAQAFDWHNFCQTYHRAKTDLLKKMHESLVNCCKTIWSDIDSVMLKNPRLEVDFDSLDLCLNKYLKFGFSVEGSPYFAIATLDGQVQKIQSAPIAIEDSEQEALHNRLNFEELLSVSKPDLSYLALIQKHLQERQGKLDYVKFLREFSKVNRDRLTSLLSRVEDNFQAVLGHEKRLRKDEKFTLKSTNFLSFMRFLKKYQQIYTKYTRVKEELASYMSFVATGKAQAGKSEPEQKDVLQTPEPKPVVKIAAPVLNSFRLTGESPGIDLTFLALMDEAISPYGFSGLIHSRNTEPVTPVVRNTSFVPFQPIQHSQVNASTTPLPAQPTAMEVEHNFEDSKPDSISQTQLEPHKTSVKTHHNPREDGSVHELVKHDHEIESDCCICFSSETSYSHPVIYCSDCEQGAHLTCLNMREIPSENYYCLTCQHKNDERAPSCYICKNRGFMLLQASSGDKTYAYHMICVVATKSWSEIYDQQKCAKLKTKSKTRCHYCEKLNLKNSKMLRCADCKSVSFHSLCAFFNGLYFDISLGPELTYENFASRSYDYAADIFCEQCSIERLNLADSEKTPLDIIYMNAYLRLISVWPRFVKQVPSFEKYKGQRNKDCKFWSKV